MGVTELQNFQGWTALLWDHGALCWQEWKGCTQNAERTEERKSVGREGKDGLEFRGGRKRKSCLFATQRRRQKMSSLGYFLESMCGHACMNVCVRV